jgi:hypothetical protein
VIFNFKSKETTPIGHIILPPGRIVNIRGFQEIEDILGKSLIELDVYYCIGDIVSPLASNSDRAGHIIVIDEDAGKALSKVNMALKTLIIDME